MASASSSPREPLVPTINFSMVCPGVYRSGYPTKKNYSFLCALRLRSILYLCPEDYAESNLKFCEENGIHVLRFPTEGNKEPFNDISEPLMHRILGAICDTRNMPLLIHCNKGKHRTGTVVACLRHLQGWSLVSIFEEYKRFASDKARVGDQQYVELYHPIVKLTPPFVAPWVTITPRVTLVTSDRELMEAEAIQLGSSLLAPDKPPKKAGKAANAAAVAVTATVPPPAGLPLAATAVMTASPPISTTSAGQAAATTTSSSPAAAAAVAQPPPPSPNLQSSPPVATAPATPAITAATLPSSSVGVPSAMGGSTASLPPAVSPPPTPPGAKQQSATVFPSHITVHNASTTNTSSAAGLAASGAPSTTTTTTNVMTNTTSAVASESVAPATSGTGHASTSQSSHGAGSPTGGRAT